MDPRPFSLRELYWMGVSKQQNEWAHTSWLSAMIANSAFSKKQRRPFQPHEFNPLAKRIPKRRMSHKETKATLMSMAGVRLKGE